MHFVPVPILVNNVGYFDHLTYLQIQLVLKLSIETLFDLGKFDHGSSQLLLGNLLAIVVPI